MFLKKLEFIFLEFHLNNHFICLNHYYINLICIIMIVKYIQINIIFFIDILCIYFFNLMINAYFILLYSKHEGLNIEFFNIVLLIICIIFIFILFFTINFNIYMHFLIYLIIVLFIFYFSTDICKLSSL